MKNEVDKPTITEAKTHRELAKNNMIMMSNLDKRLNEVEMKIFNYGLFKLEIEDGRLISRFSKEELEAICNVREKDGERKHITLKAKELTEYMHNVSKIGFSVFNEEFFKDEELSENGRWSTRNLIEDIDIVGKDTIVVDWINSKKNYEILTTLSEKRLLLDLDVMANLSDKGMILYETLKVADTNGLSELDILTKDLITMFKPKGKTVEGLEYLKRRYIKKAVTEVNQHTELEVMSANYIKEGRNTTGIRFVWKNKGVKLSITVRQLNTIRELTSQFEKFNDQFLDDGQYQQVYKELKNVSEYTMSNVAFNLIHRAKNIINPIKKKQKEFKKLEVSLPYASQIDQWKGVVSNEQKMTFAELMNKFPEDEQQEIADLVITEGMERSSGSFNYCLTTLTDWYAKDLITSIAIKEHLNKMDLLSGDIKKEKVEVSEDFLSAMNLWSD